MTALKRSSAQRTPTNATRSIRTWSSERFRRSPRSRVASRACLYPGCDFHLSYENLQNALAEPRPFTINHGQYLLVEFADFAIPPRMDQTFFQLRSRGTSFADLLRQSVYSRLAGYEDVNDAKQLSRPL